MEVYAQASQSIEKLLRVKISSSQVYRISDKYGELIEKELKEEIPETVVSNQDIVYSQVDGGMIPMEQGWQEVKVGRIFKASDIEKQSQNTERKQITHSQYVTHLGHYEQFTSIMDKGLSQIKGIKSRLVFITDGAQWIDLWVKKNYPQSTRILDYYHVTEHLSKIGKLLIKDDDRFYNWFGQAKRLLLESQLDQVIDSVHQLRANTPQDVDEKLNQINYLKKNKSRMDYKTYRDDGLQIGSGAIEAAHRTVVQKRMKLSGQRWSNDGARKMLNLRTAFKSQRWNLVIKQIARIAA